MNEPIPDEEEQVPSARPVWILMALFFLILIGLSVTTYVVAFDQEVQTVDSLDDR